MTKIQPASEQFLLPHIEDIKRMVTDWRSQTVCTAPGCHHRFSHQEDCRLHQKEYHDDEEIQRLKDIISGMEYRLTKTLWALHRDENEAGDAIWNEALDAAICRFKEEELHK